MGPWDQGAREPEVSWQTMSDRKIFFFLGGGGGGDTIIRDITTHLSLQTKPIR